MKKLLVNLLKVTISALIIWYVFGEVRDKNPGVFRDLVEQPKDWPLLGIAWILVISAVFLTFVRWYLLVRAIDLPFRLRDAFRLGFLGYLFNFISLGAVGGDLFKAVFVAREQPQRKTAAVTTIFVDRVLGFMGLLFLASLALAFVDQAALDPTIQFWARCTLFCTAGAAVVLLLLLFQFAKEGAIVERLCRIPRVGTLIQRIYEAASAYRKCRGVLLLAVGLTMLIHALNVVAFYFMAHGFSGQAPSLAIHLFFVPLGLVSMTIPLPGEALGAFEFIMNYFYAHAGATNVVGQGLLLALAYRVMRILVAVVGVGFYLSGRRKVHKALQATGNRDDGSAISGQEPVAAGH